MRAGEGAERGLEVGDGPPCPRQLALVGCKQEGRWLINIGEGECGVRGGRAQEGGDMPTSPPPSHAVMGARVGGDRQIWLQSRLSRHLCNGNTWPGKQKNYHLWK